MISYVLDTSALLTYIENEEGSDEVAKLLHDAIVEDIALYVSTVSYIEVFYHSLQEQGREIAEDRLKLLDDLMVLQEPVDSASIKFAGEFKASKRLSFADCCIAALAKIREAKLVHKDPEYEQLENQVEQIKLPYKPKKKKE